MRRGNISLLSAVLGLSLAAPAAAQTPADVTATITVGRVLFISVNTNTVTFNSPTAADFTAGSIAANNTTDLTYGGSIPHDVQVQTTSANMVASSGNPANIKPATDLRWSPDGTVWTSVSTTATTVADDAPAGTATTIRYRMLLDYTKDAPDTYTVHFTYTIVAA